MRIVFIDVRNFRGIRELEWAPSPGINCLIGPGDSTKTTVLDAIDLVFSPRSYLFADDSDFFAADHTKPIAITVTLADLPTDFVADHRYGMHLRGWNARDKKVEDEPGPGLEDALSLRVLIDESLEARWCIFHDRIDENPDDWPVLRYKDSRRIAAARLGPYAERHLGWGRQSVLTRIEAASESISARLASASRAAREAFRSGDGTLFAKTVARAEELGKRFSVPVRDKYRAVLDVQGIEISSGGVSLHDGDLPLRRLGTGSSRLLVSALQHDAGPSHVALIDEVEHGLEPHRIARLLKHLKSAPAEGGPKIQQVFMTTHSPVVVRELNANEIFTVRSVSGTTAIRSVSDATKDVDTAQRHLRRTPEAFLARRIMVGEGKTEQGLLRGLDLFWIDQGKDSCALRGIIAVDGNGNSAAPTIAEHLLDLGYGILLLLDTDEPAPADAVKRVRQKGGIVIEWPDECSTEQRVFLDVPWQTVIALVRLAESFFGADSVQANINNACLAQGLEQPASLALPSSLDRLEYRRAFGTAAKKKNWFKDIDRAERFAAIVAECLPKIPHKPLAAQISKIRCWVDA